MKIHQDLIDALRGYACGGSDYNAVLNKAADALSAIPAGDTDWINKAMAQAQVFASSWPLVGGRFASENQHAEALEEKANLRRILADAQAALDAQSEYLIAALEVNKRLTETKCREWNIHEHNALRRRIACLESGEEFQAFKAALAAKDAEIAMLKSELARPESTEVGIMRAEILALKAESGTV
jgi:hypothetical protein